MDQDKVELDPGKEVEEELQEHDSKLRGFLVLNCSRITVIVYMVIAILLVVAIILATVEAAQALVGVATLDLVAPWKNQSALNQAVSSILFIIVLATLIDLVRSYLKYGRVLVRPILVAGITTMVRRLLVWEQMSFAELLGIAIIILVLTFAIVYLGREDRNVAKFSNSIACRGFALPSFKKKNKLSEQEQDE